MSIPEVQSQPATTAPPATPAVPSESSSLIRWLIAAGLMVALGGVGAALIKMMPKEGLAGIEADKFLKEPTSAVPGKVVLDGDPNYNFGVLAQRQQGSHTWVMKNEGLGDLLLSKGEADCSCTIANFSDSQPTYTLKAGDKTEITLSWNTRDFDGGFTKHAAVNVLNDPNRSEVVFKIDGSVRPAIAVRPAEQSAAFGSIPSDQVETTKFALASADKPDLKILKITTTSPDEVTATYVPLPEADRKALEWQAMKGGYLVNVEVKPSNNLGVFQDDVIVTTNHPLLPEVKFTVGGKRVGPITLTPDSVRMHQVKSDEGATTTVIILVRNAPETKFEVVKKPDNLKVEIIPADVKAGSAAKIRRYKMIVTVPPGTPSGVIDETITLKSDHPQARQMKIAVDVIVLGGE